MDEEYSCDGCGHTSKDVLDEVLQRNYKPCSICKKKTIRKRLVIEYDNGEMYIQEGKQCVNEDCNELGVLIPENKDWDKIQGRDGKLFN